MAEEAIVASNRIPKAFIVMLLVALSLSFFALVLVGPIKVLLAILVFLASIIAWVLSIAWLPKGPDGSRLLYVAPLVLAPILLIGPAGELTDATVTAIVAEQRAQTMMRGAGAQHAIGHLREAREANAAIKFWMPVSALLGLLAAVLELWGIRWRTGESPGKTLVVLLFVLFASFGPLVHLYIRVLVNRDGLTS